MPAAQSFAILLVGMAAATAASAESWRSEVEVTLFAVPETVWQQRFEGRFEEHPALWLRLNADANAGTVSLPVDFKFRLTDGDAFVQRKGAEEEFAEGWRTWDGFESRPTPLKKTSRFIGTSVELAQESDGRTEPLRLKLDLEHHIAPPRQQRFNYANAATGADRDRLSVEYPRFEKLEWHGKLTVWREWRLVANVLHVPVIAAKVGETVAPSVRFLLFIKRA